MKNLYKNKVSTAGSHFARKISQRLARLPGFRYFIKATKPATNAVLPKPGIKRILVVSNCQTYGLANCLTLCSENVIAEGCHMERFQQKASTWQEKIHEYDYFIIDPEMQRLNIVDFSSMTNVIWLPSFIFGAFHQDLTYANHEGIYIKTPIDDYHSRLVLTGYKHGLSARQTERLFNITTYEKLGYLNAYEKCKSDLFLVYDKCGIDIRASFLSWMRDGVFMHSINHPNIRVVYDLAVLLIRRLGLNTRQHSFYPHDNLLNGPIFPVYPEIASHFGLSGGSYFYKGDTDYRTLSLSEFIDASYEIYKKIDINKTIFSAIDGVSADALNDLIAQARQ